MTKILLKLRKPENANGPGGPIPVRKVSARGLLTPHGIQTPDRSRPNNQTPGSARGLPISASGEERMYRALVAMYRAVYARIRPVLEAEFTARFKLVLKSAPAVYDPESSKSPVYMGYYGLTTSETNAYIVSFSSMLNSAAKNISTVIKQAGSIAPGSTGKPTDVRDDATYEQIINQQVELCAATLAEIDKATQKQAGVIYDDLRAALLAGQKQGVTLAEFTKTLSVWFEKEARWRARRIAHTESARALNYGVLLGTKHDDTVVGYEWIVSDDACPACLKVGFNKAGKPKQIPKNGYFLYDWRPTTPEIYRRVFAPPLHPNCRCTIDVVLDIDEFTPSSYDTISAAGKLLTSPKPESTLPPVFDLAAPPPPAPPPAPKPPPPPPPPAPPPPPPPAPVPIQAPVAPPPAAPAPVVKKPRKPRTPKPKAPPAGEQAILPQAITPAVTRDMPASPTVGLEFVKKLGGSTGAELVRDTASGELFVRKKGQTGREDALRSESWADDIYRAMGTKVPDSQLYETSTGPYKLSRYLEGAVTLQELKKKDTKAFNAAIAKMQATIAVDAVLGNWDVVGQDGDNVMVTPDGEVWRIDNGGSLEYRAQGQKKDTIGPNLFSNHPVDLWNMTDKRFNNTKAPEYYASMAEETRMESVRRLPNTKTLQLPEHIPAAIREKITARIDNAREALKDYDLLTGDTFMKDYSSTFARAGMNIKNENVLDTVAKTSLKARYIPTNAATSGSFKDEKGRGIRDFYGSGTDPDSPWKKFMDAMVKNKLPKWDKMASYMAEQAGSSSSATALGTKYLLATEMMTPRTGGPMNSFYWHGRDEATLKQLAENYYPKGQQRDDFKELFAWQHAYTYNLLRTLPLENKSRDNTRIAQIRTIDRTELNLAGAKPGDKNIKSTRGLLESFAFTNVFGQYSNRVSTYQSVPLHRGFVSYLQGQDRNNSRALLGNGEAELVVMAGGDMEYDAYDWQDARTNMKQYLAETGKKKTGVKP